MSDRVLPVLSGAGEARCALHNRAAGAVYKLTAPIDLGIDILQPRIEAPSEDGFGVAPFSKSVV